ncbi:hypothetical protein [Aeoliella sp.]|uniref:hypothetical protein n=1 Tax=Aeoliella sp. TaxID=2795800 RepID=UPI003CCC0D20
MRCYHLYPLVWLLSLAVLAGCGDNRGLVPVSGTVTIDGKPLTVGQVMVSPEGHRQSIGPLDDQGRFTLTCYEKGDGAPVGTFPVAVMAVEQISERELRWHAPRKYANELKSGITATIDGPTDDLKIELSWDGSRQKGPFVEKF